MIQRDYLLRLIERAAEALARAADLGRAGKHQDGLVVLSEVTNLVLGRLRPAVERLDAASAALVVGRLEIDRLRVYAAVVGEEGAIHELAGDALRAGYQYNRALALYAAGSLLGARIHAADRERIVLMLSKVVLADLDPTHRRELAHMAAGVGPPA